MIKYKLALPIIFYVLLAAYLVFATFFVMLMIIYPLRNYLPILLLAVNAAVNIPLIYFSWLNMPKRLRGNTDFEKGMIFFLYFLFCGFLPVIGTVALAVATLILHQYGLNKNKVAVLYANYPELVQEKIDKSTGFSVGGAYVRLKNKMLKTATRIQALSAINVNPTPFTNQITQEMLKDEVDEVRLFAFSLLSNQEKEINKRIHHLLEKARKNLSLEQAFQIEKQLAFLYWELYYMNLAQKELKNYLLIKAKDYAKIALEKRKKDGLLYVLLGRISLVEKNIKQASEQLEIALSLGVVRSKVIPYLAELAFQKKEFTIVRQYFLENPQLQDIPKLAAVYDFWSICND